jgi:hypothetical protein
MPETYQAHQANPCQSTGLTSPCDPLGWVERHPGRGTPTARMQALARQVAQERGLVLPATTLRSFYRTRGS